MKKTKKIQTILKWDNKFGSFEAVLWDGIITDIRLLKQGGNFDFGNGFSLCNGEDNVEFLKAVIDALREILKEAKN